jgi:hypothetical protein
MFTRKHLSCASICEGRGNKRRCSVFMTSDSQLRMIGVTLHMKAKLVSSPVEAHREIAITQLSAERCTGRFRIGRCGIQKRHCVSRYPQRTRPAISGGYLIAHPCMGAGRSDAISLGTPINENSASRSTRQLIVATTIGDAFEFFDLTVYSFFAVLLGKLFFPVASSELQLMLSVGTFGVGFVARPLGGVLSRRSSPANRAAC